MLQQELFQKSGNVIGTVPRNPFYKSSKMRLGNKLTVVFHVRDELTVALTVVTCT
jgi:hypothetical protein